MNSLRYIVYMRKSTEQEDRQSLSIPAQKRKLQELFPDLNVVDWVSESKSAYYPGREKFEIVMRRLLSGEVDGLISWHPDRLSRNEVDAAQITYGLRMGLIKDLKFGSYFFDNSPEGIMMLQNVTSHSQYSSSKMSKDVKRGNEEQRRRGWLTGKAMEGYLNSRNSEGDVKDHGIIIKDPERFDLRRKMWDLMLTGQYSVPQIADIANNKWGYMTRGTRKAPSGPIGNTTLYQMFNNPRYAGMIPIPGRPGEYEKASYPAMVTIDEFDLVQSLLGKRATRKLATKKDFIYRGILMCGECGCSITAEEKIKKLNSGGVKKYIYYHCTHKRPCSQRKNIREEELDMQFDELLSKYTILPQFKEWALKALESQNEIETRNIDATIKSQNKNIESAHREMKGLIKMASKELITETQFIQEKEELDNRINNLQKELSDTQKRAETWYETAQSTFELAVNGRRLFNKGDYNAKKSIIAGFGSNPVLLDGKIRFTPSPWLIPIEKGYKELEQKYEKVRTSPQQIKKDAIASIRSEWLGW